MGCTLLFSDCCTGFTGCCTLTTGGAVSKENGADVGALVVSPPNMSNSMILFCGATSCVF